MPLMISLVLCFCSPPAKPSAFYPCILPLITKRVLDFLPKEIKSVQTSDHVGTVMQVYQKGEGIHIYINQLDESCMTSHKTGAVIRV